MPTQTSSNFISLLQKEKKNVAKFINKRLIEKHEILYEISQKIQKVKSGKDA